MLSGTQKRTRNLVMIGVLSAIAFAVVALGRIPLVLFLKYDPKDIVIAIGGLAFGPLTALFVSIIVPLIEMVTISETGPIGMVMNLIASASFACTAAVIYRKKHSPAGAVVGLVAGWAMMVAIMVLWNYLITPLYLSMPRDKIVSMILPVFLPFNLIKGGINAGLTLLLYKPIVTGLRKARLLSTDAAPEKMKLNIGVIAIAALILATSILLLLVQRGVI